MKQALVFSDSHGRIERVLEIIKKYPRAEAVFHCGDIEGDADRLRFATPHPVSIVRGNCDYTRDLPQEIVTVFGGKKIALCHGHRHSVYRGSDILRYWGMEKEADIVLFGHTHVPYLEQGNAMTILNPGSISRPRQEGFLPSYAVLEIENGVVNVRHEYCR